MTNNFNDDDFFIDVNNGNKISRDYTQLIISDSFRQEYEKILKIIGDYLEKELHLKRDLELGGVYAALYFQIKMMHKEITELLQIQVKEYGKETIGGKENDGEKETEERILKYLDLYLLYGLKHAERVTDPKKRIDYFHIKNKRMLK
jgi:hypothetical protein